VVAQDFLKNDGGQDKWLIISVNIKGAEARQ